MPSDEPFFIKFRATNYYNEDSGQYSFPSIDFSSSPEYNSLRVDVEVLEGNLNFYATTNSDDEKNIPSQLNTFIDENLENNGYYYFSPKDFYTLGNSEEIEIIIGVKSKEPGQGGSFGLTISWVGPYDPSSGGGSGSSNPEDCDNKDCDDGSTSKIASSPLSFLIIFFAW